MKRQIALLCAAASLLSLLGCQQAGLNTSAHPSNQMATNSTSELVSSVATTPSTQIPTTVIIDPTTLPTQPTTLPIVPTTLPTQPTTLPIVPTTLPTQPTTLPIVPTTLPIQPTTQTTVPTTQPSVLPDIQGPKEELDPGTTWLATCNQSMSLRRQPDVLSSSKATIPAGAKLKLLGWEGKFAYVSYKNKKGYVLANYIKPADGDYMLSAIDTIEITHVYTYEQMMKDLEIFQEQYPNLVELEIIGQSERGLDIPVIRVGDPQAKYQVVIQGAIHGREHMTAWLCMALLDYWLDRDLMGYGDVCYHVIPMLNPDGVIIAQSDKLPSYLREIYRQDKELGYATDNVKEYLSQWKANGLGVDLNRNFPAGWESLEDAREDPSSMMHPGTEPFSAKEARLLRDYTKRYDFDVTISYHAMGSVIYYEYGNKEPVNTQSESLGKAVGEVTGYYLLPSNTVGGGGYKDWAINTLQIPSLTIEIGSQDTPLTKREIYSVFVRNCDVLPAIAQWLQK